MQGGDADYLVLKWNLSVSKNQLVLAKDDERVCVCVCVWEGGAEEEELLMLGKCRA